MAWGKPPVQGASRGRADREIHLRNCLFLFEAECIPFQREPKGGERRGACWCPPDKVSFLVRDSPGATLAVELY